MATNIITNEATFIPDAFTKSHEISGVLAFAKRLQTLLIMEPGTIPNATEIGVGIGTYISEFADNETLDGVTAKINNQITRFIPNPPSYNLDVSMIRDKSTDTMGLAVKVKLLNYTEEDKNTFALVFKSKVENGVGLVVSDFYF